MKNLYKGMLTAIGIVGLSSLSWGQCFNPAITPEVTTNAFSVAVGDFNGDGKADVAAANTNNGAILVLLSNGVGNFSSFINYKAGLLPIAVAVGDFNNDGKLDLVAANEGANTVSVLVNNGAGIFGAPVSFGVGVTPKSVVVADFNGDGKLDLATANYTYNDISVAIGNGNGGFNSVSTFGLGVSGGPYANGYNSIATSDFNKDGKPDLVMVNSDANLISVLLGNGNGSFNATNFSSGSSRTYSVAVGDFNNDGNPDLVTANYGPTANRVSVLLGNGTGNFGPINSFPVGQGAVTSVAVGDFNGDNNSDLATANNGDNTASVLLGDGKGNFGVATGFGVGLLPIGVAVGDFNSDSKPDIVTANYSDNAVSTLLNCTQISTPPTSLTLTTPTYDCTTGLLSLSFSGGNGTPVEYRIAGLRAWATNNSFTVPSFQRNGTTFTLEARQSGQVVSAPFLTACQSTTTTPPTSPTQPTGTGLTLTTPAYDCNAGLLTLATTGGNGAPIDFRIAGLRDYATSPTFLVPAYQRMGTSFTLEARQSGVVVTLPFTSACQSTTTTPPTSPTQPTGTTLSVSAQPLNCQIGALQLVTTGGDGTPIDFKVPGLRDYGSSALFTVPAYQRSNTTFTLYARQNGREVTGTYAATCPVSGRLASTEPSAEFRVVVYPNPVGEQFSVGVSGASGQLVRFHLTNLSGQTVVEQRAQVSSDAHSEMLRLPASGAGLYLLQVSTDNQSKTVKVLKP